MMMGLGVHKLSFIASILTLFLLGCSGKGIRRAESILEDGWARVDKEDSESEPPLYCYRTLGYVECYKTPDPRRAEQLVTPYPILNASSQNKRPTVRRPWALKTRQAQQYEHDLARADYQPTLEQQAYTKRMNAYVAVQDQVAAAKSFDEALFAKEQADRHEKVRQKKEIAKKQAITAEVPKQRTVSDILSVLRGQKKPEALTIAPRSKTLKTGISSPNLTTATNTAVPSEPRHTPSPGKPLLIK